MMYHANDSFQVATAGLEKNRGRRYEMAEGVFERMAVCPLGCVTSDDSAGRVQWSMHQCPGC